MEYVEQRNGGYYVAGTRVSLDSVVYEYWRGESAEGIVEAFPALTLEQVFGALAFYLKNREHVEEYLRIQDKRFQELAEEARRKDPEFHARLDRIRQRI
jgi:uncharacterized protein (DUF433 family)